MDQVRRVMAPRRHHTRRMPTRAVATQSYAPGSGTWRWKKSKSAV